MLVMSMKNQEVIYIGENIQITVVEILRGKVRIGVDAPREMIIHRGQFTDMKRTSNADIKPQR